ncbi:MAG: hypothetical protein ACREJD_04710 [Phycisphaerales bacterium]
MIEVLYADGAECVTVMDIHKASNLATTDQFVVALPATSQESRDARARLLARCSLWSTEQGFDPIAETGQQYEFVWFD